MRQGVRRGIAYYKQTCLPLLPPFAGSLQKAWQQARRQAYGVRRAAAFLPGGGARRRAAPSSWHPHPGIQHGWRRRLYPLSPKSMTPHIFPSPSLPGMLLAKSKARRGSRHPSLLLPPGKIQKHAGWRGVAQRGISAASSAHMPSYSLFLSDILGAYVRFVAWLLWRAARVA